MAIGVDSTTSIYFRCMHDFIKHANTPPPSEVMSPSSREGDDDWAGGTFDEAVKLATSGWLEGVQRIKELMEPLLKKVDNQLGIVEDRMTYDIEGCDVDVAEFLDDNPECMLLYEDGIEKKKWRRILVNISAASFRSSEQLLERGARIASLVWALEKKGVRCEIVIAEYAIADREYHSLIKVKVKDAGAHLDESRIAYAIAHPTMLRRLVFSVQEHQPYWFFKNFESGYGAPADLMEDHVWVKPLKEHSLETDLYVGITDGYADSDIDNWIKKVGKAND